MILDEYREEEVPINLLKFLYNLSPTSNFLTETIRNIESGKVYGPPAIKDNGDIIHGAVVALAFWNLKYEKIKCQVFKSDISLDEERLISIYRRLQESHTWQNEIVYELEFHRTAQKLYGKAKQRVGDGWSIADSAKRLNIAFGKLSEDLSLAEALEKDKYLGTFKDKQDAKAFYRMEREIEKASRREPSSYSGKINFAELIQPELFIRVIPENVLDCIISEIIDPKIIENIWTKDALELCFSRLRDDSYLILILQNIPDFMLAKLSLASLGFEIQDHPMIWIDESHCKVSKYLWQTGQNYKPILIAGKGKPSLCEPKNLLNSIISCPNKEIAIKNLLRSFTNEQDLVLDPFAGDLASFRACRDMNRRIICIEKDRDKFRKGCFLSGLDPYTGEPA